MLLMRTKLKIIKLKIIKLKLTDTIPLLSLIVVVLLTTDKSKYATKTKGEGRKGKYTGSYELTIKAVQTKRNVSKKLRLLEL